MTIVDHSHAQLTAEILFVLVKAMPPEIMMLSIKEIWGSIKQTVTHNYQQDPSQSSETLLEFVEEEDGEGLLFQLFTGVNNRNIFKAMIVDLSQVLKGENHFEVLSSYL